MSDSIWVALGNIFTREAAYDPRVVPPWQAVLVSVASMLQVVEECRDVPEDVRLVLMGGLDELSAAGKDISMERDKNVAVDIVECLQSIPASIDDRMIAA